MLVAIKSTLLVVFLGICFPVLAGEFKCHAFGDSGCAHLINDVVTDKFIDKFPAKKYEIVVIYQFQIYSDGGGVGYAVAGVAPVLEGQYANGALVPKVRFVSTVRIDKTRKSAMTTKNMRPSS